MTDSYQFDLDLLTSFDARSPGGGVLSSDEGVRTFQQMVADGLVGGSAVVRVKLRHEPNTAVITDTASGDEIEHIPFSLISQVSHVVSDRSCAPFDNILVFTVLEDEFQMAPPEMYFFQCLDTPVCFAHFILDKIKYRRRHGIKCGYAESEARRTESVGGVLGERAASPLLTSVFLVIIFILVIVLVSSTKIPQL